MSYNGALSEARDLRDYLQDRGVKTSIELIQGRPTSIQPSRWHNRSFRGALAHHIVSYRYQGTTPFLYLVKKGRVDVPGPLANGYGGWDLVYRIICMGYANHPGRGGPWRLPSGLVIPRNNGRPYLFGTEYEGGVRSSDWNAEFHNFMDRSQGAILAWLRDKRGYSSDVTGYHDEHSGWAPGRKSDRKNISTAEGRRRAGRYVNVTGGGGGAAVEDDDMKMRNGQAARVGQRYLLSAARKWNHLTDAEIRRMWGGDTSAIPDGVWGDGCRHALTRTRERVHIPDDDDNGNAKRNDVLYVDDREILRMYDVAPRE